MNLDFFQAIKNKIQKDRLFNFERTDKDILSEVRGQLCDIYFDNLKIQG